MDAFYASVEQHDNPSLKGKPVIVGGSPESRGVVCAASYEARKFGVRSALSCAQAKKLCPQGVFVYPRFNRYSEVSKIIHTIFHEVTDCVEPLSLDEAFLDVTENKLNEKLAQKIALWIKNKIKARTGITASAGVGPNKLVAKIASAYKKPDGLTVVHPQKVLNFLENLPVSKLWSVGPKTEAKLNQLGIYKTKDLRECKLADLEKALGQQGLFLRQLSLGEDPRPVEVPGDPKSQGSEYTFEKDIFDVALLEEELLDQAEHLSKYLTKKNFYAKTITLKVKYHDFTQITRSQTLPIPFRNSKTIIQITRFLLNTSTEAGQKSIRLVGTSLSGFVSAEEKPLQLWFDLDYPENQRL